MPRAKRPNRDLWEKLRPRVREMRAAPTAGEQALWQALRGKQLAGAKFRRQHAIDRFVVDFYCAEHRLVIELHGPVHDDTHEQDRARENLLRALGLRILRPQNEQVIGDLTAVIATIVRTVEQSREPSSPSPHCGEGAGG